jgi:SulP family sulfate permease
MLFVFEYSRVEGIRFAATGRDYQSRMLPDEQRAVLERIGGSIVIMKLSGFIFFGTSDRIIQRVANRVVPSAPEPVRFVVMDFRRVSGIDSSTVMSFDRLRRLAEQRGISIVLAGLNDETRSRLTLGRLNLEAAPFHTEPDLDAAVAFAEREVLTAELSAGSANGSLARQLGSEALAEALKPYCEMVTVAANTRLIQQGSSADDIFFIASGDGVVALDDDPQARVTLMRFGAGTVLGEVAFYRGERRSASAIASTEVTAWKLSRTRLADIERQAPALAAAFHYEIARALAERLQSANRLIRVLSD